VLPFANLSDDSGQEYFSDGLTEEMIAQLGRLCRGRIGIIARHSSMVFKGTTQRVSEIGEALRADYLLEGSVRREGDRVRVTARLVETEGETHLWADTYDRDLIDCLAVQADVATRIASSLAIELVSDKSKPLVPTPEPAAYQSYLKGRYYWNKPGDDGVEQALSYFGQALRIDPAFAAAHAGIARARILRAEYYGEHPRRALEAAQASALRALEIDPDNYRAHLALGEVRRMLNWDWRAAEEAYSRSIALNPSSESAHRGYAMMLAVLSRTAEAEREVDRAHEVDPLCLVVGTSAAWVRFVAGDYESVIERCLHIIDMDPGYVAVRRLLGAAYLQAGRRSDAIAAFESGLAQSRDNPLLIACLAHALGTTGDRASAADLVAEVLRPRDGRHLSTYHLALAHIGAGDHDAAFGALSQACSERDPLIANMGVDPRFEPLRSDERFEQLLLRMGIPRPSSSKLQVPSREVSSK
jgi:TolB-like protein/tetratricopeptide (TPR) repeat protein